MPGPRIRYNAIETLSMIKSPAAVPALLDTAKLEPNCLAFVSMRSGSRCAWIRWRPRRPLR
jgi:HEAT repeat protein